MITNPELLKTLPKFVEEVDDSFKALFGLSYSSAWQEVRETFDPDGRVLWRAAGAGSDPAKFAQFAGQMLNLQMIADDLDSLTTINTELFNRHRLALKSFTTPPSEWKLGTDGNAYRLTPDQHLVMMDVSPSNGVLKWSFRVQVSKQQVDPSILDADPNDKFGRIAKAPSNIDYQSATPAFDIDIAEDKARAFDAPQPKKGTPFRP